MSVYTLIPLLPLVASLTVMLLAKQLEGKGQRLVVPAIATSFAVSVMAFIEVQTNGAIQVELFQFLKSGQIDISFSFYIDQLTVLILLLVTGVSAVVHVYASRYMIGDARHSRFFALTALFTAAMTLLVMSGNLLMTFVFWELMGICSYLLVSHYAQRPQAAKAATKVFLVNSIADVGFLVGIVLAFKTFGTLDIAAIIQLAKAGPEVADGIITIIVLCIFCGAVGKSAQMPAHVWLPFAMEAPTPVSALIHAATMVNAGPFLLVRLSPLLVLSPTAMLVITCIGALTALFASVVSLTQTDIKRTLAYSTISQLGFMVLLCGTGAFVAAIFHLIAHGFFKAFLFLSTGNALAGTHRHLESSSQHGAKVPTHLAIGALVLALVPALIIFSGPYQELWLSQQFTAASTTLWVVAAATIFVSALYVFRSVTTSFVVQPSGPDGGQATISPNFYSLRYLFGIAVFAAVAIALLIMAWTWFTNFLSPVVASSTDVSNGSSIEPLIYVVVGLVLIGWGWGWYSSRKQSHKISSLKKRLYVFFLNKGYFDEIYQVMIVNPILRSAHWTWQVIDQGLIDRIVVGFGSASTAIAHWLGYLDSAVDKRVESVGSGSVSMAKWIGKFVDNGSIKSTADGLGRISEATGHTAKKYEPHTMQHNLLVVVFWLVGALGFFYWLAG
ncbi:MAG: NADH-quinone oxidoreductase subunit L [Kangiellaceae bacterium]|jgi:NADH-quinone oxidoreductase subunit L|nr:NADH-quinone oxidoreductase subunit L [Kangiellaceae bacterium]